MPAGAACMLVHSVAFGSSVRPGVGPGTMAGPDEGMPFKRPASWTAGTDNWGSSSSDDDEPPRPYPGVLVDGVYREPPTIHRGNRSWRRCPPQEIPEGLGAWREQYDGIKDRYRFCVIEGPGGSGNTYWALRAAGISRAFTVDCKSGDLPSLKGFSWFGHDVIIWDNAAPALVLAHEALFQATPTPLPIRDREAGTGSDDRPYEVFTHEVKMIACSRNWSELRACRPMSDQSWLYENSVICHTPLAPSDGMRTRG